MSIDFDANYYIDRVRQERERAASTRDRAAAMAHEELAKLYEVALATRTLNPDRMPSAYCALAGITDQNPSRGGCASSAMRTGRKFTI